MSEDPRIAKLTKALQQEYSALTPALVAKIIDTLDATELPAYPTDEMVEAYRKEVGLPFRVAGDENSEYNRRGLAAALAADPRQKVIEAAVALRDYIDGTAYLWPSSPTARPNLGDLRLALFEAGL